MKKISNMLDSIAKSNGYRNGVDLLSDYNFPLWSRLIPKHKRIEIIPLIFNHIKNKNQ